MHLTFKKVVFVENFNENLGVLSFVEVSYLELLKKGSSDYQLTAEQKQCVEMALQGKDLKIKAFAGSGKTSTLVETAKNYRVEVYTLLITRLFNL